MRIVMTFLLLFHPQVGLEPVAWQRLAPNPTNYAQAFLLLWIIERSNGQLRARLINVLGTKFTATFPQSYFTVAFHYFLVLPALWHLIRIA